MMDYGIGMFLAGLLSGAGIGLVYRDTPHTNKSNQPEEK